jgi:Zn-dependent metalloprotease
MGTSIPLTHTQRIITYICQIIFPSFKEFMQRSIIRTAIMATGVMAIGLGVQAQTSMQKKPAATEASIPVKNGSVATVLTGKNFSKATAATDLARMIGLTEQNTFRAEQEKKDKKGKVHASFQQYFDGVRVEEGKLIVHYKDGQATSVNGRVAQIAGLNMKVVVPATDATALAKSHLNIVKTIRDYPVETVIATIQDQGYALAHKVRVDGQTLQGKLVMMQVYVDAQTGKVLQSTNLIAHTDVNGTAHTLYSGVRTITTDSTENGYRLRDNARKIHTYDVGGRDMPGLGSVFFQDPRDYYNETADWTEKPALMTLRLNTANPSLITGLGFQSGKFITSVVLRDNGIEQELVTWPDVKITQGSTSSLPVVSRNIYVFPTDTNYFAGFGKLDIMNEEITDSAFFKPMSFAPGIYPWADDNGNAGVYEIENTKNPALDAHWGMEMTYDYYVEKFGRESYDGNGSIIRNFMNGIWPQVFSQNNAAALPAPYFSMVYGFGDGEYMNPVVGLDVMGHEYTHMVTETNGNGGLDYQGESGALNESFSDIFGACIEFYTKPDEANWTMGEDLYLDPPGYFRSMSDPKSAGDPDTYRGQYWKNTSSQDDNGGVHSNSGVQNKWFYLLCEGGSGTNDKNDNYSVTAIGIEKAEQIAYHNLMNYLTPQAKYQDAYNGSLLAVQELFDVDSTSAEYQAVKAAWFAVGIGDQQVSVEDIQLQAQNLSMYPNPANGSVTIASDLGQAVEASIVNMVGVPVVKTTIRKGINQVDLSTLAKGMYLVKYELGGKSFVQKLSVL